MKKIEIFFVLIIIVIFQVIDIGAKGQYNNEDSILTQKLLSSYNKASEGQKRLIDDTVNISTKIEESKLNIFLIKFFISLFIILLFFIGLYLYFKRYNKRGIYVSENIDILEEYPIDFNSKIVVLRFSDRILVFVLNKTGNASLLTEIKGDEALNIISSYSDVLSENYLGRFSNIIDRFLDKYREKPKYK